MAKMIARRNGTDFDIYADGFNIGRLADCEVCHVFQSEDKELEGYIIDRIEGDMSVREMLAEVRKGYEAYDRDQKAIVDAEYQAENAWLHHAERFDPEAQADLELHNWLTAR